MQAISVGTEYMSRVVSKNGLGYETRERVQSFHGHHISRYTVAPVFSVCLSFNSCSYHRLIIFSEVDFIRKYIYPYAYNVDR